MNGAAALRTDGRSGRWYEWKGERFWSVTTIISGGIPKRALINWAANEVAGFALGNVSTIQAMLENDERDACYDLLKRSPWRKRDKAADIGSQIHEALEAHMLEKPMPPAPLPVKQRVEAFQQFLKDYQPEFFCVEAPVISRTQRYAGTLDAIATIDGRTLVLDFKSGKRIYPEVGLQLAAYRYADSFVGVKDGSEHKLPEIHGAAALHLPEEGGYELLEVQADEEIFMCFQYVKEVFRFVEDIAKGVIRSTVPRPGTLAAQETLDFSKAMSR